MPRSAQPAVRGSGILAEKIEALNKKRGEYAAYLSALEKSGESQVSLTDPDSRAMAAHTKVGVGYNIQITAVDAEHKMIVEQAVSNDVLDMGLLQCTAGPAREFLRYQKKSMWSPSKGLFSGPRTSHPARKPA